jgi:hypothetical protein
MAQVGRPPKPLEEKVRLGNPGKRPLPDRGNLVALPGAAQPPDPARPLGQAGRELWERVWTAGANWLAERVDAEQVLILCEQVDERQQLRVRVLRDNDWRDRAALRALDAQVMSGLSVLGFNPVDRSRLGAAEVVKRESKLDALRRHSS